MRTTEADAPPGAASAVPGAARRRPPSRRPSWASPARLTLAAILVLVVAGWEVGARVGLLDVRFVSRPSAIVGAIPVLAAEELVVTALATTGVAMVWATVYGIVLGTVLGYLMGFSRVFRDAFYGPALFLLSVPKSIFIPIFLVFFGVNTQTAIYYGAFSAFIYVLVNVVSGFDLIQEQHLRIARAFRASLRHRILDVVLPASLPGVFTGIWYGIKSALQGVLIMELFASVGGLGRLITLYTNQLQTERVFALILGVSVLAILVGTAWTALEDRLARWRGKAVPETSTA